MKHYRATVVSVILYSSTELAIILTLGVPMVTTPANGPLQDSSGEFATVALDPDEVRSALRQVIDPEMVVLLRTTAVAAFMLLSLPFSSSAQERVDTLDSAVRIIVRNENWNSASLDFYCSGGWTEGIRAVELNQTATDFIDAEGCYDVRFTIDLLTSSQRYFSPPIPLLPGDCISITVGTRLWNTTWVPCRASERSSGSRGIVNLSEIHAKMDDL